MSILLNLFPSFIHSGQTCRDVLKPTGVDRCSLSEYVEDCANDEGSVDYVAFFFCAFSPDKMPIALVISVSVSWNLLYGLQQQQQQQDNKKKKIKEKIPTYSNCISICLILHSCLSIP